MLNFLLYLNLHRNVTWFDSRLLSSLFCTVSLTVSHVEVHKCKSGKNWSLISAVFIFTLTGNFTVKRQETTNKGFCFIATQQQNITLHNLHKYIKSLWWICEVHWFVKVTVSCLVLPLLTVTVDVFIAKVFIQILIQGLTAVITMAISIQSCCFHNFLVTIELTDGNVFFYTANVVTLSVSLSSETWVFVYNDWSHHYQYKQ